MVVKALERVQSAEICTVSGLTVSVMEQVNRMTATNIMQEWWARSAGVGQDDIIGADRSAAEKLVGASHSPDRG